MGLGIFEGFGRTRIAGGDIISGLMDNLAFRADSIVNMLTLEGGFHNLSSPLDRRRELVKRRRKLMGLPVLQEGVLPSLDLDLEGSLFGRSLFGDGKRCLPCGQKLAQKLTQKPIRKPTQKTHSSSPLRRGNEIKRGKVNLKSRELRERSRDSRGRADSTKIDMIKSRERSRDSRGRGRTDSIKIDMMSELRQKYHLR